MKLQKEYEIVIDRTHQDNANIEIFAEGNTIKLVLNEFKIFNTMANIDTILMGLNDKVKELIQRHLEKQATQETELKEGC